MFEIKEITVNCAVSKNYQKAEFSMTATVECDEDIASIKAMCTQHALQLLDTLPIKEEAKQPVQPQKQFQQNTFQAPRNTPVNGFNAQPQYQGSNMKPASQKQLDYLKNAFHYVPQGPITFEQANELLMQFKAQR